MNLSTITALVLTLNEEANIARLLDSLVWAQQVVVLDSESTDRTREIVSRYPNVRLESRPFDRHALQWNHGLHACNIDTEWVLALDADYVLTGGFLDEVDALTPEPEVAGYQVRFTYCVSGRPLWGSLYPPVTVLYRRGSAAYIQDGHTQRVGVKGKVKNLRSRILHDDRKPLSRWLASQERYTDLEARKIDESAFRLLPWPDRIRKWIVVAPVACLPYCLFLKGGILQGFAGLYYAWQRTLVEILIALKLLDRKLYRRNQASLNK